MPLRRRVSAKTAALRWPCTSILWICSTRARRLRPSFPPETDVFISTSSAEKKPQIEAAFADLNLHSVTVTVVENQGRDVARFCVTWPRSCKDYDYACFMHDKKAIQTKPGSVGASFGYVCNENVCKNAAHVLNVLCEFEKDPYLGILCPPYPTHGLYFMNMCSGGWGPNFENTKKLMKDLGIDIPISGEKSPIAPYGSAFWFRPKALEPLFDHGWQAFGLPARTVTAGRHHQPRH